MPVALVGFDLGPALFAYSLVDIASASAFGCGGQPPLSKIDTFNLKLPDGKDGMDGIQ